MSSKKSIEYHPMISNIIETYGAYIQKTQKDYGIISDNLRLLLALHLFKYSLDDLYSDHCYYQAAKIHSDIIKAEIDFVCKSIIMPNKELYTDLYSKTLPKYEQTFILRRDNQLFEIDSKTRKKCNKVFFNLVSKEDGILIQEKLHYIGQHRADTLYHCGLFREGAQIPFAYSAFSILDRNYLINLPYFENYAQGSILVNTRNFGFKNNPLNSMSALFKESTKYIRQTNPFFKCIVSAINPNLMFNATSYYASGFQPIATSPLNYAYIDGIYATRRQLENSTKKYMRAKTTPDPVIWFVKTINKKNYKPIKELIDTNGIINITKTDYLNK